MAKHDIPVWVGTAAVPTWPSFPRDAAEAEPHIAREGEQTLPARSAEGDKWHDRVLRLQAEMENFRRRQ